MATTFDDLLILLRDAREAGLSDSACDRLRDRIQSPELVVAVMAPMKSGKSTFMNALIGKEFLPSSAEPETTVLVKVEHDAALPEGNLLDSSGLVVASGREPILKYLERMNRNRRAGVATEPKTVTRKRWCWALGNYFGSDGRHFAVRSLHGSRLLCITVTHQGVTSLYKLTKYDASVEFDYVFYVAYRPVYVRFSEEGMTVCQDTTSFARRTPLQARVLRAKCVSGQDAEGMIMGTSGVHCQVVNAPRNSKWSRQQKHFLAVNSDFVVADFNEHTFTILVEQGLKVSFPRWKGVFQFLDDDIPFIVGEPVKDDNGCIGIVTNVSGLADGMLTASFPDGHLDIATSLLSVVSGIEEVSSWQSHHVLGQGATGIPCWVEFSTDDSMDVEKTQLEVYSFTLRTSVMSCANISDGSGQVAFKIMDTPGPNEAHAGLVSELKAACKEADVFIYMIDYTKFGTQDEQHMFEALKADAGHILQSVNERCYFVLNKVDEKQLGRSIDDIKGKIAQVLTKMVPELHISARHVVPLSSRQAFLGRQCLDEERLNTDMTFVEEVMSRVSSLYEIEYPDRSEWPKKVAQWAPTLVKKSLFPEFESSVFANLVSSKFQLVLKCACDSLAGELAEVCNACLLEKSMCDASDVELEDRARKATALESRFNDNLQNVKLVLNWGDFTEPFRKLTRASFEEAQGIGQSVLHSLFGEGIAKKTPQNLKDLLRFFGSSGNLDMTQKHKTKEAGMSWLKKHDELMLEVCESILRSSMSSLQGKLAKEFDALQASICTRTGKILDDVVQATGDMLSVQLHKIRIDHEQVTGHDVGTLLTGAAPESLWTPNTKKGTKTTIEKRPWRLFWLIPLWKYDCEVTTEVEVTESFNVKPKELKERWTKLIQDVICSSENRCNNLVDTKIETEITQIVDIVDGKCRHIIASLKKKRTETVESQQPLSIRKSELESSLFKLRCVMDRLQAFSSKTLKPVHIMQAEDLGADPRSEQLDEADHPGSGSPETRQQTVPMFEPMSGPCKGGFRIKYVGDDQEPEDVKIAGVPCSPVDDGEFMCPRFKGKGVGDGAVQVDFEADGIMYEKAFTYFALGTAEVTSVAPSCSPSVGGVKVEVNTTCLHAQISKVLIGGTICELDPKVPPSDSHVVVIAPKHDHEGPVDIEVHAANLNVAKRHLSFSYYRPIVFGHVGKNVQLSDDGMRAERSSGLLDGICFSSQPLLGDSRGFLFELVVGQRFASGKGMAIGFLTSGELPLDSSGVVSLAEARTLMGAMMCGYESKGGLFVHNGTEQLGTEQRVPWRPAADLKPGMHVTALLARPTDPEGAWTFSVFVDGMSKVVQCVHLPEPAHGVHLVVDLQGSVKEVAGRAGLASYRPLLSLGIFMSCSATACLQIRWQMMCSGARFCLADVMHRMLNQQVDFKIIRFDFYKIWGGTARAAIDDRLSSSVGCSAGICFLVLLVGDVLVLMDILNSELSMPKIAKMTVVIALSAVPVYGISYAMWCFATVADAFAECLFLMMRRHVTVKWTGEDDIDVGVFISYCTSAATLDRHPMCYTVLGLPITKTLLSRVLYAAVSVVTTVVGRYALTSQ